MNLRSEFPDELAHTLEMQVDLRENNPDVPEYAWEASRKAARTLQHWQLPTPVMEAALIVPPLMINSEQGLSTRALQAERSLKLTKHAASLPLTIAQSDSEPELSSAQSFLKLRRLFRWAYLDLDVVLLAMAIHDALLTHPDLPEPQGQRLKHETQHVFVPVAEMLGMWKIRRKWLDRSAEIASRRQEHDVYDEILRELENSEEERSRAYSRLQKELCSRADEHGIDIDPRLRPSRVGSIQRRHAEGESLDEITTRLTVEIRCASEGDCYHALGLVHRLGKPVAPRLSERFDDYIASPQPNGYRALHTAINYEYGNKDEEDKREVLVEFRILTQEMHNLNQWGIVEALHRSRNRYRRASAWWNPTDQLPEQFKNRYRLDYTIEEFVATYELDSRPHPASLDTCLAESCPILPSDSPPPHPVYVFTPRGEIHLLSDGATALDFAYQLHSEIGHHVRKIWVNGRSVPLNHPLHNGDIIRIDFDPHAKGPDYSWLGDVVTGSAGYKIRRRLAQQAERIHPGRYELESILHNVMRYYEREKGHLLRFTTKRLVNFLIRMAKAWGFPDIDALYSSIQEGDTSPDKIVHRFISEDLAVAIVDRQGNPIFSTYPPYRISLCGMCHPIPDDPIIGRERRSGAATVGLAVHRADNDKCPGMPAPEETILLHWAEPGPFKEQFLEFEIAGIDRHYLLGDVLDIVYDQAGLELHEVTARAEDDGRASISMVISGKLDPLTEVRARTEEIPYVHTVYTHSLALSRKLALTAQSAVYGDRTPNPYTLQEVYGRSMFYNRENPLRRILEWLEAPPPAHLLVVHGPRRIGKTSLAKHLINVHLDSRRVRSAFVDFQELAYFTSEEVARLIVQQVYNSIGEPAPAIRPHESPANYLSRALEQAISKPKGYRLLIVVDEFNILMQQESQDKLDPTTFSHLRSVFSRCRDVHFLLIVQDTFFQEPSQWGRAGNVLQQAHPLELLPLDANYARKLVTDPMTQHACTIDDAVVDEVLDLAAGVPYYIHILCSELIEHINQHKRKKIQWQDLQTVLPSVLSHGDRYFHHFIEDLHGLTRLVLAIAAAYQDKKSVTLSEVHTELNRLGFPRKPSAVHRAAKQLEHHGMLELSAGNREKSRRLHIPIGLFHRWLQRNLDPATVVEEIAIATGRAGRSEELQSQRGLNGDTQ